MWVFNSKSAQFKASLPICLPAFKFGILLLSFYAVSLLQVYSAFSTLDAQLSAQIAVFILNNVGEPCHAVNQSICIGSKGIIDVLSDCTALESVWIFCAAALAFNASARSKALVLSLGLVGLPGLNVLRLVSLYLAEIHFNSYFDFLHHRIWPIVFDIWIVSVLVTWGLRASRPQRTIHHAVT